MDLKSINLEKKNGRRPQRTNVKKYLPNTEKYWRLILDEHANDIKNLKIIGITPNQASEVFCNIIFNRNGPRQFNIQHSPKTLFIANKLFWPMSEIFSTMWAIENIPVYMNIFPYSRHEISKVSYLRYHIENFLNEIYILQKRLEAYSITVIRTYKREHKYANIGDNTQKIQQDVIKALAVVVCKRHPHIHQYRYKDRDLDHLSLLELYSKYEDLGDEFWRKRSFFDQAYKKIRKKKVKEFKGIIESLWVLLETYFKVMLQVVSKDGKIVYPRGIG